MRTSLIILLGLVAGVLIRLTVPTRSEKQMSSIQPGESLPLPVVEPSKPPEPPVNPAFPEPQLYCRGYIVRNNRANVVLSDGTTWTEQKLGELIVFRHHVIFRGKFYPLKIVPREAVAAVQDHGSGFPSPAIPEARAPEARSLLLDTTAADLNAASKK